jgi:hypothetical protein
VETGRLAVMTLRGGAPLTLAEHFVFAPLLNDATLGANVVVRRQARPAALLIRRGGFELEAFPDERLHFSAMRTRHKEFPLVTGVMGALNAAEVLYAWRAGQDFDAVPKCGGAFLRQVNRVTLGAGAFVIAVNLIRDEHADGHGGQAGGRVGSRDDEHAAGEFFVEERVAGVTGARRRKELAEHRGVPNHFGDTVLAVLFRLPFRCLDGEDGAGVPMGEIAYGVKLDLALAGLGGHHHNHGFRVGVRDGVLDAALEFGKVCAVLAGECAGLFGDVGVLIGPLGEGERGRGEKHLVPGGECGVKAVPTLGSGGVGAHSSGSSAWAVRDSRTAWMLARLVSKSRHERSSTVKMRVRSSMPRSWGARLAGMANTRV